MHEVQMGLMPANLRAAWLRMSSGYQGPVLPVSPQAYQPCGWYTDS